MVINSTYCGSSDIHHRRLVRLTRGDIQRVVARRLGSRSHERRAGGYFLSNDPMGGLLIWMILFFVAVHSVFESQPGYHFPFVGLLLVISAFAISPPGRVCGATKISTSG